MRQILFKAKRLDNNEWITGDLLQEVDGAMYIHTQGINTNPLYYHKVDPSTVCQFTGLTNKNGKEIWEHDVISIFSDREPCEVVFEKGCFIAINSKGVHTSLQKGIDYYDWDLQVIGNKFDGKEEK